MNLSKKRWAIFGVALFGVVGSSLSIFGVLCESNKFALAEPEFSSCASIKFADNFEADYSKGTGTGAYDYTISGAIPESGKSDVFAKFGSLDTSEGLIINSFTSSKVYYNLYNNPYSDRKLALKFSSSSASGSLSITFNKKICGVTLYAALFEGQSKGAAVLDSTVLKVNDITQSMDSSYKFSKSDAGIIENGVFKAYSFVFDARDTLTITTVNGKSSRFYLADIAIRVAMSA